jgi:hypothetical protein
MKNGQNPPTNWAPELSADSFDRRQANAKKAVARARMDKAKMGSEEWWKALGDLRKLEKNENK